MVHSSIWKLICAICVCNILTVGVHLLSTPSISGPGSATVPSRHIDGSETWTPPPEKKPTQSYRFPCEYWYGPPGKSQSYPASIPALASQRHRSKVQNYDASCFILANDGLMLFCASRRLWRVYTFAQAYLSLRHCTKISG